MNKGFTLLETVIYVALLGVIMGTCVATAYSIKESQERSRVMLEKNNELLFLIEKIHWATLNLDSIQYPAVNTTAVKAKFTKRGYAENSIELEFASGVVYLTTHESKKVSITGAHLSVTDFRVEHGDVGVGEPERLIITIIIDNVPYSMSSALRP
jgi:hypothetical protein